jgi:hypothetical protein
MRKDMGTTLERNARLAESRQRIANHSNRDRGFKPGDTIRMPHYETTGGYRVWAVQGVHLGGEWQEGTYHLRPVDVHDNETIHVPCIILETHPAIERV